MLFRSTLTIRKWSLRQLLNDGITRLRNVRANYLAEEERKLRQAQLDAQAEQDRINRKAADDAAKAAKAAGADKATVQTIKQEVLATPAPIVTSKALDAATSTVRYGYSAKITDLPKFLKMCLENPVMLNTLKVAIPDMESAFRKMAGDQKENFIYAGITFDKKPIDVGRR